MGFLAGKKALITGVASQHSIAWGIAQAMFEQGCALAFTYQFDKLKSRVEKCAKLCQSDLVLPCDLSSDEQIEQTIAQITSAWQTLDIIVHSVAFAPRSALSGDYLNATTRDNFIIAHNISSYTLTALAKAAKPILNPGGALITVSYLGAERVVPNYNVMGVAKASLEANVRYLAGALGQAQIRVNAVSAGPIKTLAASGIQDFSKLLNVAAAHCPLKRNITAEEVGNAAAFLCSDLASGITGEVIYVDAGYRWYDNIDIS